MEAIIQPVTDWWRAFSLLVSDFFNNIGPKEYGYILVVTGIVGYLFMKSSSR